MSGRRRRTGGAGRDGIEAGLDDLLGALGSAVSDILGRLEQGGTGEIRRDIVVETAKGPLRAHAGLRLRLGGLDGGAGARDARDLAHPRAPSPHPSPAAPVRPIAAEIVDDGFLWRLTADLPGVSAEDLGVAIEDGALLLSAEARGRRYADRIVVPPGTSREALRVSLQNGILEIEAPSEGATRQ